MSGAIWTVEPALLTGPYDWDSDCVPLSEFETRVAQALARAAEAGATMLLVHGDRAEHGTLAYLTGFTPKLGPALALFPLEGTPLLLFSGGPGMADSARRLTWLEEVRALGPPSRDLAPLAGQRVALAGEEVLSHALHASIANAVGATASEPAEARLVSIDDALGDLRRRKSATEQELLRRAACLLGIAADRLGRALERREPLGEAILTAERSAYAGGAQDVRILVAERADGPPLPVTGDKHGQPAELPAPLHLAVRCRGYWAQGWLTAGLDPEPSRRSAATIRQLLPELRAGATLPGKADLKMTGIGLSLAEPPVGSNGVLCSGSVLAVRLATDEGEKRATLSSALVLIGPGEPEILWSTLLLGA